MLPLAATVLMPAFARRVLADVRWAQRTLVVCTAGVVAALVLPSPPLVAPGMAEARDFIVTHVRPGDVYAVDARTHLQARWLTPEAHQVMVSASWHEQPVDAQTLLDWLRANHVKYVLLDAKSSATLVGQPRYLFYDRLPLEKDGSLPLSGFPGGLKPVYVDPNTPRRWIVLETPWTS
jgi:hypothetical protein